MKQNARFKKAARNIYVYYRSLDRSIESRLAFRNEEKSPRARVFCEASRLVSALRYGEEASFEKRFTRSGRIEECTSCLESPGKQHKRDEATAAW